MGAAYNRSHLSSRRGLIFYDISFISLQKLLELVFWKIQKDRTFQPARLLIHTDRIFIIISVRLYNPGFWNHRSFFIFQNFFESRKAIAAVLVVLPTPPLLFATEIVTHCLGVISPSRFSNKASTASSRIRAFGLPAFLQGLKAFLRYLSTA